MRYKVREVTTKKLSELLLSKKEFIYRWRTPEGKLVKETGRIFSTTYGGYNYHRRFHENTYLHYELGFPKLSNREVWVFAESEDYGAAVGFYKIYKELLSGESDLIFNKKRLKIKHAWDELESLNSFNPDLAQFDLKYGKLNDKL